MHVASSHAAAVKHACTAPTAHCLQTRSFPSGTSNRLLHPCTAPVAVPWHAPCPWHAAPYQGPMPRRSLACPSTAAAVGVGSRAPNQQLDFEDSEWREAFHAAAHTASDNSGFVELGFKGKISQKLPYRQVVVRPVQLKAGPQLQFSYFGERQNVVKNAPPGSVEAADRLNELLHSLPFSSASLKTIKQDVSVQLTKSGRAIVHRTTRAAPRAPIQLGHDRRKGLPIPPDVAHPFLQQIGMQTADGRLKADMVDKMAQVNDFLKLLGHTGVLETMQQAGAVAAHDSPVVRVLDAGCGSSHLTFGTWHYLNNVLGLRAQLVGVDSNATLMAKCNSYCRDLGLTEVQASFVASSILDYQPAQPPHVVLALHACDTATDEALALAVKQVFRLMLAGQIFAAFCAQRASVIMAVPCCHKHLHRQLSGAKGLAIDPLQPLMRQGIMRQRTLDLITDTFRAQLLRILGYKTDVVEFVSTEHTPRNLLIRAVLQQPAVSTSKLTETQRASQAQPEFESQAVSEPNPESESESQEPAHQAGGEGLGAPAAGMGSLQQQFVDEYQALKGFWGGCTPYLETLLQQELSCYLSGAK